MLKGQAKKDYQREYMREYMKGYRSNMLRPIKTPLRPDVKTQLKSLKMEGNRILGLTKTAEKPPLYNPAIHRVGDRVLIKPPHGKRLIETIIPKIDADGNMIYEEG